MARGRSQVFHFVSGRLCLDFANTGGEREGVVFEDLRTPEDLVRWFAESGLVARGISVSEEDLKEARLLRDAVWRSAWRIEHRRERKWTLDPADIVEINEAAVRSALVTQIVAESAETSTLRWARPITVEGVLATIARDAIETFTGEWTHRIRECANPNCILLFLDTSRPGRRRWCSMKLCGNLEKTSRYRRRRTT